jgi:hypothetical protein
MHLAGFITSGWFYYKEICYDAARSHECEVVFTFDTLQPFKYVVFITYFYLNSCMS